ncbi:glycosyl transferase [alpha proteobacterium U9-1i]|nr:glycosyl transferase [alpha proteobacterium U9-1i]
MTLSAIVVSYRTGPVLDQSLAALLSAPGVDQIVLVDNGNPADVEAELDACAAREPKLKVLRGHGNVGFGAGCNRGADAASGDILLFVNPDAVLAPAAPAALSAVLTGLRAPAIAGGDLRDEEGRPERGSRRDRVTVWSAFVSFSGLSRFGLRDINRHNDPMPQNPIEVGAISGALFAMRRADFLALSGFDEGYFLHVEDIDLCRRAAEAGGKIVFAPGPHGVHVRSSSDAPVRTVEQHKARSFSHYFRKFARNPIEVAAAHLVGGFLLLRAALTRDV